MVLEGSDMTNSLWVSESEPIVICGAINQNLNIQKIRILITVKINKNNKRSEKVKNIEYVYNGMENKVGTTKTQHPYVSI